MAVPVVSPWKRSILALNVLFVDRCVSSGGAMAASIYPAHKRRKVSYVGDVPKLFGGIPASAESLDHIFFSKRRD